MLNYLPPSDLWKLPTVHSWIKSFESGSLVGLIELDKTVFGESPRSDLLYRALRYEEAWRDQRTESSKALGQVRGTTRKPFPQKGRGRARHGTLRAAQFVGGMIIISNGQ
jgi:large subunit ribosomal protein L4